MTDPYATAVLALTACVFACLIPFAWHRSFHVVLSRRSRTEVREPWPESDLPRVTVQLPMFNERAVARRVIDAACSLDYPTGLLDIQVLDDGRHVV